MTVIEYEAWVSDNYEAMLALARQQCRAQRSTFNEEMAIDLLHHLVEQMLEKPALIESLRVDSLMGWFNRALWRDALNAQRDAGVRRRLDGAVAEAVEILGCDAYVDAHEIAKTRRDFNKTARKQQAARTRSGASPLIESFTGPMPGCTRWRFQTMRDGRLFDERAVRSLAESIHRASHSYRHFGEHGFAYSEFGQEVSR